MIFSFPFENTQTQVPKPSVGSMIGENFKHGALTCGMNFLPHFVNIDREYVNLTRMEIDICRGIAAAIFNGKAEVQFTLLEARDYFSELASVEIDIVAIRVTKILQREIWEATTVRGFNFSLP